MKTLNELSTVLDTAAHDVCAVPQIDPNGELTFAQAYEIQKLAIEGRVSRGHRRTGVKMGFTSRSKMVQMGLSDVIWGRLTSDMALEEGALVSAARFIHPRVEPELAFILSREIAPDMSAAAALACVEAVAPALEIIDSRYDDFKFSLTDVIADNASSSGYVIGPWCDPKVDFSNLGLTLSIDGRVVQVGSTAAILGHPLRSLIAAARLSAAAGEPLKMGSLVMAGGATAAEWIHPGSYVCVDMEHLGHTGFHLGK